MMVVVKVKGIIIIENVVCELEIVDLVNILNKMGVYVYGVGIEIMCIEGVDYLYVVNYLIV